MMCPLIEELTITTHVRIRVAIRAAVPKLNGCTLQKAKGLVAMEAG